MVVVPPSKSLADPVLPHASRLGLLLWFVAQWVLIPLDLLVRIVWLIAIILGNPSEDMLSLRDPLARFLSPRKLLLRMSHNPARHEAYLDREFARLSPEVEKQRFGWRTRICHRVDPVGMSDGGYLDGVFLDPREYRGVPFSTLKRIGHAHRLAVEPVPSFKSSVALGPVEMRNL